MLTSTQRATAGRGLFAGLQDTKHYNVESGWARRKSTDSQTGFLGSIWGRYVFTLFPYSLIFTDSFQAHWIFTLIDYPCLVLLFFFDLLLYCLIGIGVGLIGV
jgi:hypothetical protein